MASGVPSFIRKSVNYEELFDDDDEQLAPIEATPISKMKETPSNQEKSSHSSKRKFPPPSLELARAPGPQSSKKLKVAPSPRGEGQSPSMQKFFEMVGNQIPDETVTKWDKMSLLESAKAIPLANAQSFFHYLKHGEEIVRAARGDQKLMEEVKQLKATLKTRDEDKKKLQDAVRKLRASDTKLNKERDQLNNALVALDKEKEELEATHAKAIREWELKVETLNTAVATERSLFKAQKKARYEAGYKNGINDYMASTKAVFPDLDWSKLETATAEQEQIQQKEAVDTQGPPAAEADAAPSANPTLDPEVQESGAETDIPSSDPVSTEVTPDEVPAPAEVVSTAPAS